MAKGSSKSNAIVDKAKTKTVNSKSVTNLKITRNGGKFTATWKNPVSFSSIKIRYRLKVANEWKSWSSYVALGKSATSKQFVTIDWDKYYPNKSSGKYKSELHAIEVMVATDQADKNETVYEKKKGKWHKHTLTTKYKQNTEAKKFDVIRPSAPNLSVTSGTGDTTFNWSVPNADKQDDNVFIQVEYATACVKDWGITAPSKYKNWGNNTIKKNASGSFTHSFGSSDVNAGDSYTVIARCRACGPEGSTGYMYSHQVYAWPKVADNLTADVAAKGSTQYRVTAKWDKDVSNQRPAAQYKVQYFIGAPADSNLNIPTNASWKDGTDYTLQQPSTKQTAVFDTDSRLQDEQCMWVRVIQKHVQQLETPTGAVRIKEFDKVISPEIKSISYDATSHELSVEVDNKSSFSNATITVTVGNWSANRVGSGTVSTIKDLGAAAVTVSAKATYGSKQSDTVSQNYEPTLSAENPFPFRPTNIKASKSSATLGAVTVTWAPVLKGVTSSKITVADNPNEWSIDNPSFVKEVTVTGSGTSANIGDLEFGTTYYFKVQSVNSKGTTDYSLNYAAVTLEASDAPIPDISNKAVETEEHNIRVTWNWNIWPSAKQIQLTWSTNKNDGDSDQLAVTTIDKRVSAGEQSYTIPLEKLERGKLWYIWARFVSDKAISNPSEAQVMLPIVPVAPTNAVFVREAQLTDEAGKTTTRLSWTDTWIDTVETELSWSDDVSAWEKTSGPNTHKINGRASTMLIPELDLGRTWYARVKVLFNNDYYAELADLVALDLRTTPSTPIVTVSENVVSQYGKLDVSWTYSNEDLSAQAVARVTFFNEQNIEVASLSVPSAENSVTVYMETLGLTGDNTYYITVRTTSANGILSELSTMTSFNVINVPIAAITQTSLVDEIIDEGTENERTIHKLTELPLNLTVSGANENGSVLVYIERSRPIFLARPDDSTAYGYEGELVAVAEGNETGVVSIGLNDLHVDFTDGGDYRITAIAINNLGTRSEPVTLDFTVKWTHQAIMPIATYVTDTENLIAKITPTAPEGTLETDTFDIYRLSADAPELILSGGQWGTTYVDPYPAFGDSMGHRVVFRTENGDYTTAENTLAWLDCIPPYDNTEQPRLTSDFVMIDFNNEQVAIEYNLDVSHSWEKDFTETKYLGGSVQGDWNVAVSRKCSVNGTMVRLSNDNDILKMRRLAAWPGICHVRTPGGSSFTADVQVSEDSSHDTAGKIVDFSIDITRVDSESYEAMTLADWEAENGLE